MRKLLLPFIFLLLLAGTSCYHNNKEQVKMPDRLLTENQMVEIITQIQLAEGRVVTEREKNKDFKINGKEYMQEIYEHFGITPEELVDNINYYQDKDDVLVDIYEEVLANLSTMQEEVKLSIKEDSDKAKPDSIQQLNNLNTTKADTSSGVTDTLPSQQDSSKITLKK